MKKKALGRILIVIIAMIILSTSTTAFAATYNSSNFKWSFIGSNIATKATAQDVYDYNSYFRRNDTDADTYYKSRPCDTDGDSLTAYEINFSGGQNLFNTYATAVKMQIYNYYQYGTYCRTYGTFGGTY